MNDKIKTESDLLKKRRIELGLTQMEVAVKAGIILQQYQRFEYGRQRLSNANMITALRICSALELDPYQFVTDIGDM